MFGKRSGINEVPVLPIYRGYMLDNTLLSLGLFIMSIYRHDFCQDGNFLKEKRAYIAIRVHKQLLVR